MSTGRLLLGATPLGQPDDASKRLVAALGTADVVAAEDTRRVRTLARSLDVTITGRVVSLFDQNEAARVPALIDEIAARGHQAALAGLAPAVAWQQRRTAASPDRPPLTP